MAIISGSHGNDKITGTSNDDVLKGNGGNDVIKGGNGDDTIYGGTGNDKLHGNNGGDILQGGFGNDKLYGDNEGDILQGGLGYDKLYGGAGNDTFNIFDELSLCDFHSGGDGNDFFFFDQNIPLGGWDESDEQVGITKKYGIKSEGGPGDDLWFNVDGSSYILNGAIALGNFYVDCGAGNDIFHFGHTTDSPKVLKSEGIIIDGGKGYDIIHHQGNFANQSIGWAKWHDGKGIYQLFDVDHSFIVEDQVDLYWNDFLNHSKNFEQLNLDLDHYGYTLILEDNVVNNSNEFKFLITSEYSKSFVNIDASKETGASLIFNVYEDELLSTAVDSKYPIGIYTQNFKYSHDYADFGDLYTEDVGQGQTTAFDIDIKGGAGNDQLNSQGQGDDIFQGNGGNDYFFGADGNNIAVFNGKKKQYKITELGYNKYKVRDKVKGRDGTDIIENVNTLRFSDGDYDLVIKGLKIEGDGSAEVINGGKYSDFLDGGGGNDKLRGKNGNDTILGGDGNDRLYGDRGNDQLNGGAGIDTVFFSGKSNVINLSKTTKQNTKDGIDILKGIENVNAGSGNDKVYGSKGSNILSGGKGNDLLVGGLGNDKLIGGKGKDIFKLSKGKGYDLIQDFKNKQDKIFIGSTKNLKLKNKGKDVFIYSGKDLLAKVKGAKGDLSKKGKYLV